MNVDDENATVTLEHNRGLFGKITGKGRNGPETFTPITGG